MNQKMTKQSHHISRMPFLLAVILILCFSLTACGGTSGDVAKAAHGDADYLGTYTETTYRNERYGILFTTPSKGFEFAMMEDILTANDIKEEDFSNTRVPEILASGKEYMVMYGGDGTTQNSTSVVLSPANGKEQEQVVHEAADKIKASLEADTSITIRECELKTGSPIGFDQYLVYTISANDKTFYTEQFFAFHDNNLASVTISSTSEGQIKTMHAAWKRIN